MTPPPVSRTICEEGGEFPCRRQTRRTSPGAGEFCWSYLAGCWVGQLSGLGRLTGRRSAGTRRIAVQTTPGGGHHGPTVSNSDKQQYWDGGAKFSMQLRPITKWNDRTYEMIQMNWCLKGIVLRSTLWIIGLVFEVGGSVHKCILEGHVSSSKWRALISDSWGPPSTSQTIIYFTAIFGEISWNSSAI